MGVLPTLYLHQGHRPRQPLPYLTTGACWAEPPRARSRPCERHGERLTSLPSHAGVEYTCVRAALVPSPNENHPPLTEVGSRTSWKASSRQLLLRFPVGHSVCTGIRAHQSPVIYWFVSNFWGSLEPSSAVNIASSLCIACAAAAREVEREEAGEGVSTARRVGQGREAVSSAFLI